MFRYQNCKGQDSFYKHALLDTNFISEIMKNLEIEDGKSVKILLPYLSDNSWMLTFGYANIIELCPDLRDRFYKFCADLQIIADSKSESEILEDEISNYTGRQTSEICPHRSIQWLVRESDGGFAGYNRIRALYEGTRDEWSPKIRQAVRDRFENVERLRESNTRYFQEFGLKEGINRLVRREVAKHMTEGVGEIDSSRFPSLQVRYAAEYFKFYDGQHRTIKENDLLDLTMFPLLPYVEAFLTDGNNVGIIKNIRDVFGLLENVEAKRLSDFGAV